MLKGLFAVFLAAGLHATPTFVGTANYNNSGGSAVASLGVSRTTQATTNPAMFCAVWEQNLSNTNISAITWQGQSFTIVRQQTSVNGQSFGIAVGVLTGYSSGVLGNITITCSPNEGLSAFVWEMNGVNQSTPCPVNGYLQGTAAASTSSITITTQGTNSVVISHFVSLQGSACTPPPGYTQYVTDAGLQDHQDIYYKTAGFPAQYNSQWTFTPSQYAPQILFEVSAPASVSSNQVIPKSIYHWMRTKPNIQPKSPWSFLWMLFEAPLEAGIIDWRYEQIMATQATRKAIAEKTAFLISKSSPTPTPTPDMRIKTATPTPSPTPTLGLK